MMIEQNTNYAYKLKYMDNPTFDKVRNLSTKFYRELPQALQDELFEALNRGIDILDSEPQMTAYLFAFGKMHQAKLNYAFKQLPKEFLVQPEINIIDYGCGQALGTMCYADFLRENGYEQKVKTITLIEPSEICLKHAALHASVFFPDAEIKTVNKKFDDLTQDDIVCNEETPTLHVLSNVLDMLNFNLDRFAELVKGCLKGYNQFVCVGPYFNFYEKDDRMKSLCSLLGGNANYSKVFDKYEFEDSKTWTAHFLSFAVGELKEEMSTKVTAEDLANAVEDRFGVPWCQYSYDRKKMLSYGNTYGDEYKIDSNTRIICDECFFDVYNEIDYHYIHKLYIPKSIEYIGENPFCGSIEIIVCDSPHFIVEDYFLLTSNRRKLVFYFGKDEEIVTIPEEITIIGSGAFCSTELSSVTIPSSIIEIGDNPFVDAKHWKNDEFEPCVIISNSNRFRVCNNMLFDVVEKRLISYFGNDREIEVPNGTKVIGKNAFFGADFVKVLLPNSIEYVDETAFYWCSNLFNNTNGIVVPSNSIGKFKEILPKYLWSNLVDSLSTMVSEYDIKNGVEDDFGVVYSRDGKRLLRYNSDGLEEYKVKKGTIIICDEAFASCISLQHISIPDSVLIIGKSAFNSCESLQQIIIPNSVTSIGRLAFYYCLSLQQISIPDSVTYIDEGTFECCKLLKKITIPNSITSIGNHAFSECETIDSIIIPSSVSNIGCGAFSFCKSLRLVVLTNTIIDISCDLFYECESLETFSIPNSVKTIGDCAFSGCTSLEKINIPSSVKTIGDCAFGGCTSLKTITFPITITSIGYNIFGGHLILNISNSDIELEESDNCLSLKNIFIPKGSMEKFKKMLDEELWDKLVEQ